jgi:hypothetical protein
MKRRLLIALVTAGVGAVIALMASALLDRGAAALAQVPAGNAGASSRVVGPQPDTSSSHWKQLSDDVGVMLRDDDRLGLRGRFYVRTAGVWTPVAIDGPGDTSGVVPVR